MTARRFSTFAWAVLALNLAVVVWGAYVRASGSGAGCGSHWPLCDGEVIPRAPSVAKAIEFTHRASSGLALVSIVALWLAARGIFPKPAPPRRAAFWALVFVLVEAGVGAGLVKLGLVVHDASLARVVVMPIHLVTTFLLLAALALATRAAEAGSARFSTAWLAVLALLVLTGATGALAALGDTLFPSSSLAAGVASDLAPGAHLLLRLRIGHPPLAALAAFALLLQIGRAAEGASGAGARRAAAVLVLAQIGIGIVNLVLLAPVPLQLAHLLVADLTWIAAVLAAAADGRPTSLA